jgi:hypothetical protein
MKLMSSSHSLVGSLTLNREDLSCYSDSGLVDRAFKIAANFDRSIILNKGSDVKLRFRWMRVRNLRIQIKRCLDLHKADVVGKGDPYVRVWSNCQNIALEDEHSSKHSDAFQAAAAVGATPPAIEVHRTVTMSNTSNPVWEDEVIHLRLPEKITPDTCIRFDIMDYDGSTYLNDDFLGQVLLQGEEILRLADGENHLLPLSRKSGRRRASLINKFVKGNLDICVSSSELVLLKPKEVVGLHDFSQQDLQKTKSFLKEPYMVVERNNQQVIVSENARSTPKFDHKVLNTHPKWGEGTTFVVPVASRYPVSAKAASAPAKPQGSKEGGNEEGTHCQAEGIIGVAGAFESEVVESKVESKELPPLKEATRPTSPDVSVAVEQQIAGVGQQVKIPCDPAPAANPNHTVNKVTRPTSLDVSVAAEQDTAGAGQQVKIPCDPEPAASPSHGMDSELPKPSASPNRIKLAPISQLNS